MAPAPVGVAGRFKLSAGMSAPTKFYFTRQLPSGRLILLDVTPIVPLVQKAQSESNPALLDFVDDYSKHANHFRVTDAGRTGEIPDSSKPPMEFLKLGKNEKRKSWTLAQVLSGETDWRDEDVRALCSALYWGPLAGWMTRMINAAESVRNSIREGGAQEAEADTFHEPNVSRFTTRIPPARG